MTSLLKNQILKHLTKFFKDLAPEQLQLSAFKGSCELSNLQLEEKVLMDLLSFPAWVRINKAACDQLSIKIPWTKIKSVPIQMNLNEVMVEVEVCDEFRDMTKDDEMNLANLINSQAPAGKYGFVDRVIDGITVTVNNVHISFNSKLMSATFNLSRVILESRCPNWKPGELSLTRIKDTNRNQILLFKVVEWQTMRLEAKCLTDPLQAPLRLITNHAQCRLTIKKSLEDSSVIAARIFFVFEDILWVLTFAQFNSAASFVEYVFTLIKRSPVSKKTDILSNMTSSSNDLSTTSASLGGSSAPLISPLCSPMPHASQKPMLTGNMSAASLTEQKFLCYDLVETSLHLFIEKVDAHLYDDIESNSQSSNGSKRDSGGALQTTLDGIQVDCYPYSRANSSRKHWYRWFDPSPGSRRQWFQSHLDEFDMSKLQEKFQTFASASMASSSPCNKSFSGSSVSLDKTGPINIGQRRPSDKERSPLSSSSTSAPVAAKKPLASVNNDHLLSLTVLIKIKDYCMNCVALKDTSRSSILNKFIETDKDYQMPSEMPAIYLELNYFYYFDSVNRMMIYENVPNPLAFVHLSPTKLLFDSPTLLFLNSFHVNLSKAFEHLDDLFPDDATSPPKIHCRAEILMPQVNLPAKASNTSSNISRQQQEAAASSFLLVKSGKITLSNTIYDKGLQKTLIDSIEKLKERPSKPISSSSYSHQSNYSAKQDENYCTGDWAKVWNASVLNRMTEFSLRNQFWAIQFEPVWMDFMNYDVNDLSISQRLEPIVEPFKASAFIHLNLSQGFKDLKKAAQAGGDKPPSSSNKQPSSDSSKRNVISILVSVLEDTILANMDKIQFGFLQRLGLHVEKLLQQIKEDASTIIQMDTVTENSLELNLTAYIKEIKARLILDKKFERQLMGPTVTSGGDPATTGGSPMKPSSHAGNTVIPNQLLNQKMDNVIDSTGSPNKLCQPNESSGVASNRSLSFIYTPVDEPVKIEAKLGSNELLDECIEVADDASCLLLGSSPAPSADVNVSLNATSDLTTTSSSVSQAADTASSNTEKSDKAAAFDENDLLVNLEQMEKSASLFAKVKPPPSKDAPVPSELEMETVSYLELAMSQLMVRRITETKRRAKPNK